jgi:sulfate adenylyltransferase
MRAHYTLMHTRAHRPGDVDAAVRVRCYLAMIAGGRHYDPRGVLLSLLPLAMRMAGPREALWHAIIRKNYGATHFIVGRDHAGCKSGAGKDFYGPYDAQTLMQGAAKELGISVLMYQEVEYVPAQDAFLPGNLIPAGSKTASISGTKFRAMMNAGDPIPDWYSDPAVIAILRSLMPPLYKRGFVIFFTGLSGGGKTTITTGLISRLSSLLPTRRVTVLDGDVVRTHLSKGLGFGIPDRNTNVARIGWVAAESARQGGIVIASAIAPFEAGRDSARRLVSAVGAGWLTVHVATTLSTCAQRDVKGLYRSAGTGRIDLTGVSHPWCG